MGLFGKNTSSASQYVVPVQGRAGANSGGTAETELARKCFSSKQAPLLIEHQTNNTDEGRSSNAMLVQQSNIEHREPIAIDDTSPALNPVTDEIRTIPQPLSNKHPDPELGVLTLTNQGTPPHEVKISPANSDDTAFYEMQVGSLPNPETLVMGQLIQWKFAAEEGSIALRIPAILGALGIMVTTVAPLITAVEFFTASHVIVAFLVFQLTVIICIIDGRFNYGRDPLGSRAKLRNLVTRHFNVFRLVWGRGILYMAAGLLNMAHEMTMCYITGGAMMGIGVIAVITGSRASKNLATLRKSLSDDEFLWLEFLKHDIDRDGYLNPSEFAQFIWDLGLEFDDLYTLKAFTTIDTDHDQKIAYREFVRWWSQVRLNHIS
jgi:hypothetical protein